MHHLRRPHARPAAALVAGLILVLAACGGSSSGSDAGGKETTTTKATSSTTEEPTTTTTTEPPKADAETVALVETTGFTEADLGEGWKEFAKGEDYEGDSGEEIDECLNPADGELKQLADGAKATGAIFQYADQPLYVRANVAAFPDEAAAKDWIAFITTDDYQECLRADVEEANRPEKGEWTVADGTTDEMRADVGSYGLEDVGLFEGSLDGAVQSQIYLSTYRVGRVVVWVQLDVGAADEAALDTAVQGEADARSTAFERAATAQGIPAPS